MNYFALDVETANADYSSICQVGIAELQNGKIVNRWSSLVNPETYFDPFNTSIHGITENDVKDAPTFDVVHHLIAEKITDRITVHHMPFDRIAVTRACSEYDLDMLQPKWLDSAKIARRAWEEFAYKGYSLDNIAKYLNIEFTHHDALEDAIAAAQIVEHACKKTGFSIEEWLSKVCQPISIPQGGSANLNLKGNSEGSLYGESLVFTGTLFLPRKDAARIAADLGCCVGNSVSNKTTMLVLGIQDSYKLSGYEKSSKHRKAEELIKKGAFIKILSENDFVEMCNRENENLNLEIPKASGKSQENERKKSIAKASMDVKSEIVFNEKFTAELSDEINKFYDSLTDEQKETIYKRNQEHQDLLNSIKDVSQKEKRVLAKECKACLKTIHNYYDKIGIESFKCDEIDAIDTIDAEIEQIQDTLYDLMKDKISLSEFFEVIDDGASSIKLDIEEDSVPQAVKDYGNATILELEKITEEIKKLGS